jgi:hypothetical protein
VVLFSSCLGAVLSCPGGVFELSKLCLRVV